MKKRKKSETEANSPCPSNADAHPTDQSLHVGSAMTWGLEF